MSGAKPTLIETPAIRKKSHVKLELRSQHSEYLNRVAQREDTTVSAVLAGIIEAYAQPSETESKRSARKARPHLSIKPEHLALLDGLALRLGLSRSDVTRRLIDDAQADDPWTGTRPVASSRA